MIIWIGRPLALAIHERQLAEHGGIVGIRDGGLLESALARSQPVYAHGHPPPDLADLAAALAFGIARNHPFLDGNKRTAHVCYRVFLRLNGADLEASEEAKYTAMIALAEGSLSESDFADWLRPHIKGPATPEVNESVAKSTA